MRIEDYPFIANSYLKSYRNAPGASSINNQEYYHNFKLQLNQMLINCAVVVACQQDDEDQIFGYVIAEPNKLHYVYVKWPFRRLGFGTELVRSVLPEWGTRPTEVTHQPRHWKRLSEKYKLIYATRVT